MSLIPTRLDPVEHPHAQTLLDIATLVRARELVRQHRDPHRSVTVVTAAVEDVLAAIDARIDQLAAQVPDEAWQEPPASWVRGYLDEGRTGMSCHGWADLLAAHGWDWEVGEALHGGHLPWMRFDSLDGCLEDSTLPERMLALHAHEVV